jgi:hypothetical protein
MGTHEHFVPSAGDAPVTDLLNAIHPGLPALQDLAGRRATSRRSSAT